MLHKWIENITLDGNATEAILLDSHYKFEKVDNMVGFLNVINREHMASFLHDDATRTITVVCTTHRVKDNPRMWIGLEWESFLPAMKHAKATICICNLDSFRNFFSIVMKSNHVTSFQFEFG